ncbi:hypothetical protein TWF225_007229 [Orbilia oligospora]|uniref:Uncharacterized protein n=1 Tax=Orbilia oligospora TaxID=2813651 RepID=A0A7C8P883_ORBOL|nr:hypothetical protein TWF751_000616 [Orbilia oligospora]KAF3180358.1 hypothetical protein TWF225_007229 [Orbilia oligospora]KAF3256601.1 hypothetical protein TWF217_006291 [Orbilia oligospora]KAF3268797.1 hypothetical protein TWF128_007154 [Orbilia oligospora]TGJ63686.1 hypothetical protein EYR41_011582 [Orbilia oligospora]
MQFSKLACLLPLIATALAAAVPADNSGVSMATDELDLGRNVFDKRSCKSNGCSCAKGTSAGIYCGRCGAVKSFGRGGKSNDAYQCNSSGGCCVYGHRDSCAVKSFSPCG